MRILPIFIIWAFVFFLLPKMMGNKKRSKKEDASGRQQNIPGSTENDVSIPDANMDFWRTWGVKKPTMAEPVTTETMETMETKPVTPVILEHEQQTASVEEVNNSAFLEKTNAWHGKMAGKNIRRGLIMKEVLGAPRAFNPYDKDV